MDEAKGWGAWTAQRAAGRGVRADDVDFLPMPISAWEGTAIRAAFPKRTRDGIVLGAAGPHEKTISSRNLWPFLGDIGVP